MVPATQETVTEFYILAPEFNPLIELDTRGSGRWIDRGWGGRCGLRPSRGHAPLSLKPCGHHEPRDIASGEAGMGVIVGAVPGPRMGPGPGQEEGSGSVGGPHRRARCARSRRFGWFRRDARLAPDVDGSPELGMVPDSAPGRGGRRPPPDGCALSQATSE